MPGRSVDAKRRVLILGGTAEARALAALASEAFGDRAEIVTSLAGRTRAPTPVAGITRTGGFGGSAELAAYLRSAPVDVLVDATHPFAATISAHARRAAAETGVKLLTLARPDWQKQPGDRWIEVPDAEAAAAALRPLGPRVFVTFGGRELDAFRALADKWFLVRRIDPPDAPLPLAQYELNLGRGPFTVEQECALMRSHRIAVLVTKASGGAATRAKLDAARVLSLPVVMIRRPPAGPGPRVATPEAALRWIAAALSGAPGIDGDAASP